MTRVYCPTTPEALRELVGAGQLPTGAQGFSATPAVTQALGDLSEEELEYALATAAAEAAGQALLGAGVRSGRRFVLVAEVPPTDVRIEDDAGGAVTVRASIGLTRVVAVLADSDDLVPPGDGVDLGWFATQEIPDLLA